jgi:hypothetical protein
MTTSPTLPTGPFEHLAQDYARLREEGIRLLGRLAGDQWTDYNTHDPGVTILEQLCYAITDLAYRIARPVPDLIAGTDLDRALPGPAEILACDPVTAADLRRLALDVDGVGNAWIEAPGDPEPALYHHAGSGELRLDADASDLDARPIQLSGLHRVLLQTSDRLPSDRALAEVAARLHACRSLGEDHSLALLTAHEVWIDARIEVGPVEDPSGVLADILDRIEAYLAPPVRFTGYADARAAGERVDALFEGPALARGFVLGELPPLRRALRTSDLIHILNDVPAVRAVRSLAMAASADGPREPWLLTIPAGHVATLASGAAIVLLRAGLPLRTDPALVQARRDERRRAAASRTTAIDPAALRPPPGRDRQLARYHSIQHQLPAVYGVGPLGLPASASPERKAQARQLAAYLLLFDQLLADAFAQLAHARELLSPEPGGALRTYFAQPLDEPRLRLSELIREDPQSYRAWLDAAVERTVAGGGSLERRKRFLAHLLARFAEQLGDHAQIGDAACDDPALIADREAFLLDVPRLSRARGSGHDLLGEPDAASGLARRLRLKLGLREQVRFHVLEHVLLRPVPEDVRQRGDDSDPQVPLLAGVDERDPWSLQVSFVFEARRGGAPDDAFEQMIAQTILAETPAHIRPHLRWFGADDGVDHWRALDEAWLAFRSAYREYRRARIAADTVPDDIHLRVRDARDRVIDLLGFGRTYPLRDLPVPHHLIVPPGRPTAIPIELSQRDVLYGLRDRQTGAAVTLDGKPIEVAGTGGTIELPTPPIDKDRTFRILAVKLDGRDSDEMRREAWLHAVVTVEEGVDPELVVELRDLPRLDPSIDAPSPVDARLADFGVEADVEILASQEGVEYQLLDAADLDRVLSQQVVVGTGGTIVLRTVAIHEDLDIAIRGTREVGDPKHPERRTALLTRILPLRVRADRSLAAELAPIIVDHAGAPTLRIQGTQLSAEYRVWRRRIRDREFVYAAPPPAPTLDIDAGDHAIHIAEPPPAVWKDLEPVGEAKRGTGGALDLVLPGAVEDTQLYVQANKRHRRRPGSDETLASTVQLAGVHALLVRPDPQRARRIRTALLDAAATGPLLVQDGQPGVAYELRRDGVDAPLGLPAYFHQRDDVDARHNKGLEQLRVEGDLSLARDPTDEPADLAATAPLAPSVDIDPQPLGAVLRVRARRVTSDLVADLTTTATLAAAPAVAVTPPTIKPGESAQIVLAATNPGERYRLLRGDQLVFEAIGDGARLELATGPLNESTELELELIAAPAPDALVVERRVRLSVQVES